MKNQILSDKMKEWHRTHPHPRGMLGKVPWNKGKKGLQVCWSKGKKLPQCSGSNSANWKGGKYKADGYIVVFSPDHPRVKNNTKKYLFEHILVMEKNIGRYLQHNEVVHHINGIRDDNRIENLVLMTRAQHLRHHKPHGW